jgi:hypothetical protein
MPLTPAELDRHRPYGFDLRHDLPTQGGPTVPAWSTVINLGAPDGATVYRGQTASVDLVVLRSKYGSPAVEGEVYRVSPRHLLIALGEIEGPCECGPTDPWCPNRR